MNIEPINKINVCGLGPGHPSLILPVVHELVNACDVLIGGKRNLEIFNGLSKEKRFITNNIDELMKFIAERGERKVTLVVSGDTGFYSMLGALRRHFPAEELNVVPGISSFQYMFARLGMSYEDAFLGSLHGKKFDLIETVKHYPKVFCLTDALHSPRQIALLLTKNGLGDCILHVGCNLSYENEMILSDKAQNLTDKIIDDKLCSLIIENEQ
ncbi:MAG: precorrin-6y C5,15-methyltransferase (decarboxylating) subunit CbiE [Bacteroidota bacterium]|nr:precorrin-6y C5,15-methyltransferase (decarboxylating) subunit CbiE [Bacteroidota bacterium]